MTEGEHLTRTRDGGGRIYAVCMPHLRGMNFFGSGGATRALFSFVQMKEERLAALYKSPNGRRCFATASLASFLWRAHGHALASFLWRAPGGAI